jgi:hypothetical protein
MHDAENLLKIHGPYFKAISPEETRFTGISPEDLEPLISAAGKCLIEI